MKRRSLLKSLGLLSLTGLPAIKSGLYAGLPAKSRENDKEYWQVIRRHFPLKQELAYLNNATIGPNPHHVVNAIKERLDHMSEVVDYGGWHKSRAVLANFIGCSTKELALTSNTTHGNNIIAQGVRIKKRREVITSSHEHVGNAMPLLLRAKQDKLRLKVFQPAQTQQGILDQIESLISRRTRMIAIPHISCTTGQVFPIAEISKMISGRDIFLAVDGAHGPGSMVLDVKSLGCDSYASSCHKWLLGAYGTGMLYVRQEKIPELKVRHSGHANSSSWHLLPEKTGFVLRDDNAARFMFGTQSSAQFAGSAAAVEFLQEIGMKKVEERVKTLQAELRKSLQERSDVLDFLSPLEESSQGPMCTMRPKNMDFKDFYSRAQREGIVLRQLAEANLNAIRISTHIYNSKADIEVLGDFINRTLKV